jgi:hypothetical protein
MQKEFLRSGRIDPAKPKRIRENRSYFDALLRI